MLMLERRALAREILRCAQDDTKKQAASRVILSETSNASGRKWLLASGQLRASEAGTGFEIA